MEKHPIEPIEPKKGMVWFNTKTMEFLEWNGKEWGPPTGINKAVASAATIFANLLGKR